LALAEGWYDKKGEEMAMRRILLSRAICAVIFLSMPFKAHAEEPPGLQRQNKVSANNPRSVQEVIRFERIAQLNGQEMFSEVSKLLNQHGWEGWGHKKYDFGKWTNEQMKEKRQLFDDWAAGKGFEWIDPVWSFSGNDLKITKILSGCKELTHPVIAPDTVIELRPGPMVLPLDAGLGPIAVYKIDSPNISNNLADNRYAIVVKFNDASERITDGEEIEIGYPLFYNSVYIIDLNECKYKRIANLGNGYLGGYMKDSIPRLTGVGYHDGRLALYDIYDVSPAYKKNRLMELHADLYFFDLQSTLPAQDSALQLFFRPTSMP